jgi:hypothetical protein
LFVNQHFPAAVWREQLSSEQDRGSSIDPNRR